MIFQKRTQKKKILIFAPLNPRESGGVAQYVRGLIKALSHRESDEFEFSLVLRKNCYSWIQDVIGSSFQVFEVRTPVAYLQPEPNLKKLNKISVVHFPYQVGYLAESPFIYQPHDLQHLHFPEFFSNDELSRRKEIEFLISKSTRVIVSSNFTAGDLALKLGFSRERIDVVRYGPPTVVDANSQKPRETSIPKRFLLYPAGNWPHKNHEKLLLAVQNLALKGLKVHLVLTGIRSGTVDLKQVCDNLGVTSLVTDMGYVREPELRWLYENSTALVFPSKFESGSFPVLEAMNSGLPVTCSNIPSLIEQLGGAGLVFDSDSDESIAESIKILWTNEEVRTTYSSRAKANADSITWDTAVEEILNTYRKCLEKT